MGVKDESPAEAGNIMEYTRLHITPFNASLLSAIVPPSMAGLAKNVSFHQIETFPEKEYGFVELPVEQAKKIKQKLNGAVLRGNKIVIQEARAAPRIPSPDPEMAKKERKRKEKKAKGEIAQPEEKLEDSAKKDPKESKKRKRHDEPIKGQEVVDRQIKRGWTDPNAPTKAQKKEKRSKDGDKKDRKDKRAEREKSKYTTEPECLIRMTLPPNVILPAKGIEGVEVDKKAKKSKRGKDVVVHEFGQTEKFATFLRQSKGAVTAKPAVEFVEGKGWFDEDGNVVEGEPPKPKHNDDLLKKIATENKLAKPAKKAEPVSQSEEESEAEEDEDVTMTDIPKTVYNSDSETSSSGSSASEDEDEASDNEDVLEKVAQEKEELIEEVGLAVGEEAPGKESDIEDIFAAVADEGSDTSEEVVSELMVHMTTEKGESSDSTASRPITPVEKATDALKISIPQTTPINPLEAIFKPRKLDAKSKASEPAPFKFGLGGDVDSDIEEDYQDHAMPMTPYTQQDLSYRGMRSAAPTPDTAHPSRKQMNGWPVDDEDVNGFAARSPTDMKNVSAGKGDDEEKKVGTDPTQDFQKWFYENRGDTNRAWKKRRKEVKKEVRQRENRKGGNKNKND